MALGGVFLIAGVAGQRWELVSLLLPLAALMLLYVVLWRPSDLSLTASWDLGAERILAGDVVEGVLTITYEGRGGRLGAVEVTLPASVERMEGESKFPITLEARGEVQVKYRLRFPRRGLHLLGPIKVHTMDLAGLTSKTFQADATAEVRVLPRVFEIERSMPPLSWLRMPSGSNNSKLLGSGSEFYNLRDYVAGDSLKMVNWKATARSESLIVSQFMTQRSCDVVIAIDTRGMKDADLLDSGIDMAASVCAHFLRQRDRVGLAVFGDYSKLVPLGYGRRQLYRSLEVLTDVPTGREHPGLKIAEMLDRTFPRDSLIVFITSLEDGAVDGIAQSLAWRGRDLIVVAPHIVPEMDDLSGRMNDVRRRDHAHRLRRLCQVEEWDSGSPAKWCLSRGAR